MKTSLSPENLQTSAGRLAEKILRNCVHCGFCNATCPTYQITGDELDGPRGRIYLIKNYLENGKDADKMILHLDRCLTCRNCETTCPSGVKYGQLAELGRTIGDRFAKRSSMFKLKRWAIKSVLSSRSLFSFITFFGRQVRFLLPREHRVMLSKRDTASYPRNHENRVIDSTNLQTIFLLQGCVQPSLAPQINATSQYVLQRLGYNIKTLKNERCCGAIHLHNADHPAATQRISDNITSWSNHRDHKNSLIVSTASGCGVTLKEYGDSLQYSDIDNATRTKATQFSERVRDLSEILNSHDNIEQLIPDNIKQLKIAVHIPCTLQHGMRLRSTFEQVLDKLNLDLVRVRDSHLCCGSAGTYSLFQKELSQQLLSQKSERLNEFKPDLIITANIGCLLELAKHSPVPVIHWIELFAPATKLPAEIQTALTNSS